jgi:hypothetical protein
MEQKSEFTKLLDVVKLPSQGYFYQNGVDSLQMYYMTSLDEQLLLSPQLVQSGVAFDKLIERCMVDKGAIKVEDLLIGDKNKLLLFLRVSAYGAEYKVEVVSPYSGKRYIESVDLLKIKDITPETLNYNDKISDKKTFTITTSDKHVIEFKMLTVKEENYISQIAENESKKMGGIDMTSLLRLKEQIVNLDGKPEKPRIEKFLHTMSPKIRREIQKSINEVTTGLDLNYEFKCPDTGNIFQDTITITREFFYPES